MKLFIQLCAISILASPVARAERILVLGDSHSCGTFGVQLVKDLAKPGNDVALYCAVGRTAYHFVTGKAMASCKMFTDRNLTQKPCGARRIDDILKTEKPTRVIPAFGSNDLGKYWLSSFAKLAIKIYDTGAACHWVGPPIFNWDKGVCKSKYAKFKNDPPEIIAAIQSGTAGICSFHDSFNYTDIHTTPDCIHRSGQPAIKWANGISAEILQQASQN